MAEEETFYQGNVLTQYSTEQAGLVKEQIKPDDEKSDCLGLIKYAPFSPDKIPFIFTGCFTKIHNSLESKALPTVNDTGFYCSTRICLLSNFGDSSVNGYFKLYNRETDGQLKGLCLKNKLKGAFSLVESSSGTFVKGLAQNGILNGICKFWVNLYLLKQFGLDTIKSKFMDLSFRA